MTSAETRPQHPGTLAEQYLSSARESLPVMGRILAEHGARSLAEYLQTFKIDPVPSYQPRDDLLEVLERQTAPLLGVAMAKRAARDLADFPVVLTANHHGVDYFSQSFQGNLIFAVNNPSGGVPGKTFCVFSCGNIPLNNLEYPRGLLLYLLDAGTESLTRKFPIFPDRLKRCMVSVTPAFDQMMIQRAGGALKRMDREGAIPPHISMALHKVLMEEYAAPSVIALPDYSKQSIVLNHRIWKRLFNESAAAPQMINVEFETIVSALLQHDLQRSESLAGAIMFEPLLRESVVAELDGIRGCWQATQLPIALDAARGRKESPQGFGTMFFWGIDRFRRRIPLCLRASRSRGTSLCGVDDQGGSFELAFNPSSVIENLKQGRLLPSMFTCYLTVCLARGLVCAGGYFQGEYLPAMQRALVRALQAHAALRTLTDSVSQVVTDKYLSGMLAVLIRVGKDCLIPAGPIEVLAAGGLTESDIERAQQLTVREAHLAGLWETAPDAIPQQQLRPGWEKQLARDCKLLLHDRVAVK